MKPITRVIQTIFGPTVTKSPIISDLIDSSAMQRIKYIDQGGPCLYFNIGKPLSRYDHSIGVWALLAKLGCNETEQVAGLLHDASHTAFSHLADNLFHIENTDYSYQDENHLAYLAQTDVKTILERYEFPLEKANPDLPEYRGLEQLLPDLCADRIEYNIHTALVCGRISEAEVEHLIADIRFDGTDWYFVTIESAEKLANLSLYFTREIWGSPWNMVLYSCFKDAIRLAIDTHIITHDDFLYGMDQFIMDKLNASNNLAIQHKLTLCNSIKDTFRIANEDETSDEFFKPKFRGMNPLIEINGDRLRLTEHSETFLMAYEGTKQWCADGFKVIYK